MREDVFLFYKDLTRKTTFFEGCSVQVQLFWTGTRYGLEILHQCGKRVKTNKQNVLVLIPRFAEVSGLTALLKR